MTFGPGRTKQVINFETRHDITGACNKDPQRARTNNFEADVTRAFFLLRNQLFLSFDKTRFKGETYSGVAQNIATSAFHIRDSLFDRPKKARLPMLDTEKLECWSKYSDKPMSNPASRLRFFNFGKADGNGRTSKHTFFRSRYILSHT